MKRTLKSICYCLFIYGMQTPSVNVLLIYTDNRFTNRLKTFTSFIIFYEKHNTHTHFPLVPTSAHGQHMQLHHSHAEIQHGISQTRTTPNEIVPIRFTTWCYSTQPDTLKANNIKRVYIYIVLNKKKLFFSRHKLFSNLNIKTIAENYYTFFVASFNR